MLTSGIESSGDPLAKNDESSASGMYQILDGTWAKLTKGTPYEKYPTSMSAPASVQDAMMNKLTEENLQYADSAKSTYNVLSKVSPEVIAGIYHYQGKTNADLYFNTLEQTKDYDIAQSTLNEAIKKKNKGILPTNTPIKQYLLQLINAANS
jgi:hypothetical protein